MKSDISGSLACGRLVGMGVNPGANAYGDPCCNPDGESYFKPACERLASCPMPPVWMHRRKARPENELVDLRFHWEILCQTYPSVPGQTSAACVAAAISGAGRTLLVTNRLDIPA